MKWFFFFFFFSSRRRHTRLTCDWSSDVCSSDLTGDIGRMRADGSFVYETRKGDAIRLGGFLVNPAEIEDLLKRLPTVADVQVTALEIAGQLRCVAFVVPASGASPAEGEVIDAARAIMAGFKVPARVWFVQG